ncbi:hypothetical protein [Halobacterium yunchengense]|uniref:hypothetical protein n=1 Tax=Halobacterium yunchengense TaxID=3108497 RepID=UPI003009752D
MSASVDESPFVFFNGDVDPRPRGRAVIADRRIIVRLEPHVEVGGDRVGVVKFGSDAEWVRRAFDDFVLPSDSDSAALVRVEDLRGLVTYCAECGVEVVVDREFWTYAELLH